LPRAERLEPPFEEAFPIRGSLGRLSGGLARFEYLESNEEEYELFNSAELAALIGVAGYDPDKLSELVEGLGLEPNRGDLLLKRPKLVAGYYLAPQRQHSRQSA
jgi:hypothetical protein